MEIIHFLKDKYLAVKSNLQFTINHLQLQKNLVNRFEKAKPDTQLTKEMVRNKVISNFSYHTQALNATRIYCVVNRYNEVLSIDSRSFAIGPFRPKKLYFMFVSQHDALDYLYKISDFKPNYFRKFGLSVNSFSFKECVRLSMKNSDRCRFAYVSDLRELEEFFNLTYSDSKEDFKLALEKLMEEDDLDSESSLLMYRIHSYRRDPELAKVIFLNTSDAKEYWKNYLALNKLDKRKKLVLKTSFLPKDYLNPEIQYLSFFSQDPSSQDSKP